MSQMNLSTELINELHEVIIRHDAQASEPNIAVQYLAAVQGLILGNQDMPDEQRLAFFNDLCQFTRHVIDDVAGQQAPEPDTQEAFGIWRPE